MGNAQPHVYVLATEVHGRKRLPVLSNASYRILEEEYDSLPPHVQSRHDAFKAQEAASTESVRLWAKEFLAALERGGPYPTRKYEMVWEKDHHYSGMMKTLAFLWRQGRYGATVVDVRDATGLTGNGVSGHLSRLHRAGIIERLEQIR